jgi:NADH-quinone oxidoreductase subunit L
MGGFRKALPFTSALLLVGAFALAGFPGFSGFFSKDEILTFAANRGGMYWIFAVGGYGAAFLTAFYSFRIGFRVVYGEPCDEARELEQGHLAHGEPENPASGELEDTDVGFPGPEHHIAERAWPMRVAMGVLGVGAIFGGVIQIPGVDHVLTTFFEGTFASSRFAGIEPSTADSWIGLGVGAVLSIAGIGLAYYCYILNPGVTVRMAQRFRRLHSFLAHKWYFDELLDALVYRPTIALGRFANTVIESVVVNGLVATATGAVRGAGSVVRGAQSGFVRAYALLLLGGFAALGVYFLVVAN